MTKRRCEEVSLESTDERIRWRRLIRAHLSITSCGFDPSMSAPGALPDASGKRPVVSALKPSEMINLIDVLDPGLYLDDHTPGNPSAAGSPFVPAEAHTTPLRSPRKSIHGSLGYLSGKVFEFSSPTTSPRSPTSQRNSEADGSASLMSLERIIERVTLNPGTQGFGYTKP